MGKVIVITSGKGGVGKSTCCANIGIYMSRLGRKVLVIDADIGLRNLDMVLGFEELTGYNIVDVIMNNINPSQAMISHSAYPNFYLLPASAKAPDDPVSPEKMSDLVMRVRNDFDYILIDCPAGIENGFYAAVAPADEALIVVNPEVSSIRDADRIIEILKERKNLKISLIVNRTNKKLIEAKEMISPSDITDILEADILGLIPEDKNIIISSNKGIPVVETNSSGAEAFRRITSRICGQAEEYEENLKKESLFARMTKKLLWG